MSGVIVLGAQWGDEGKGKVVDVLAAQADYVVRYQGGANAGHTLKVDGREIVLHLIPSGILHEKTTCIIGTGVVVDLESLVKEIDFIKSAGFLKNDEQLKISDTATVLMPYHKELDAAREEAAGKSKIGTTGKGIGPAYEDRAARKAILFGDIFDESTLLEKLEKALTEKNFLMEKYFHREPTCALKLKEQLLSLSEKLTPYRCKNVSETVVKAADEGKKILFEGAQGALLDIYHGTYPFVTSSSTLAGSALVGSGVGPNQIKNVVAITKAYSTRVGAGPFPTELFDEVGEYLQKKGHEFGATTGRRRRCGWIDLVALKYTMRLNGVTNISFMKLDVLSGLQEIKVCTAYKLKNGEEVTEYPNMPGALEGVTPIYETLPGWSEEIDQVTDLKDLPDMAMKYIKYVEDFLKVPVGILSVGPGREQTLWINEVY